MKRTHSPKRRTSRGRSSRTRRSSPRRHQEQQPQAPSSSSRYSERLTKAAANFPSEDRYEIILVSPPWDLLARGKEVRMKDVLDMPVAQMVSSKGSLLFVECEGPSLQEGMDLIVAWNFKFLTAWTVDQPDPRGPTLICLVAEADPKGSRPEDKLSSDPKLLKSYTQINSEIPKEALSHRKRFSTQVTQGHRAHTASKIRRDLPSASRMHLFAPKDPEEGWYGWGPDVPGYFRKRE